MTSTLSSGGSVRYLLLIENPADVHSCIIFLSRICKDARTQFELHVLTVITPDHLSRLPDHENSAALSAHIVEIAHQRLSVFEQEGRHHGFETRSHVRSGDLEDCALEMVDVIKPDVLILPRQGGDRIEELFQGAQYQLIAARCPRPVLVIPKQVG